jgi:hypothetical protein
MTDAVRIRNRVRTYRGTFTKPENWDAFQPRTGDVLLVTPAKSGTTWTQSMIAMLLHGTPELPDKLNTLSPWIDGGFGVIDDYLADLARQPARRVIKTHTPALGVPVWQNVPVIAVFRHPLEVFLSIRKHLTNAKAVGDHPLLAPMDQALSFYLNTPFDDDDIDRDTLMILVRHFEEMVLSDHMGEKLILNYARIKADHPSTVAGLDAFLDTGASKDLQAQIVHATDFGTMKTRAADFAPEANNDVWHNDQAFFAGGQSGHWRTAFTEAQIAAYDARFAQALPNPAHRRWIETGLGDV